MNVNGFDLMAPRMEQPAFFFKFILNDKGIAFFSDKQEHNAVKIIGLSYEPEYKGNAMAGSVKKGRIDIRRHAHFSDEHVKTIMHNVMTIPELEKLRNMDIYYGGHKIQL